MPSVTNCAKLLAGRQDQIEDTEYNVKSVSCSANSPAVAAPLCSPQ